MKITGIIEDASASGRTRFAFELLPPLKGGNIDTIFSAVDLLSEFDPAYINVTHHREDVKYVERPGGLLERRIVRKRPGTVGISAAIMARYGIEAVPHLICGGSSKLDIEEALIEMDFLGIENVLALRGDPMRGESRFAPNPDGYEHASQLVRHIAGMNRGEYIDSEIEDSHATRFSIGVAGYPEKHAEAPNPETDIAHLKEKVDAGAQYVVTQMFFDNSKYFGFVERCRMAGIDVPIIPGLKPFSSKAQLNIIPQTFHVDLPEELVREVTACRDSESVRQAGIEWAVKQAGELKKAGVPVIHFYTMGRGENIAEIARRIF